MEELVFYAKKDSRGLFTEEINTIKHKTSCRGVWAIWGDSASDSKFICLEVGQHEDVINELLDNIELIERTRFSASSSNFSYTARRLFPFQKKFDVLVNDGDRRHAKYREIATHYNEIKIYLLDCDENKERVQREEIEYKYAVDNEAQYWNACCHQRKLAREYWRIKRRVKEAEKTDETTGHI